MMQKQKFRISQIHRMDLIFFAILLVSSIIVIAKIKDFGPSWDEPIFYDYASHLPEIYRSGAQGIVFNDYDQFYDLKYYGPAYLVLGGFFARGLELFSFYNIFDAWHIVNYSVFVMGVICLYWLCQKFGDKLAAMLAALLYFLQPLLLGHGVINPKDTPFTAFFLLSISLGLKMIDAAQDEPLHQINFLYRNFRWLKNWYGALLLTNTAVILLDKAGGNFILKALISSTQKIGIFVPEGSGLGANQLNDNIERIFANVNLITTLFIIFFILSLLYSFLKNASKFQRSVFWAGVALGLTTSIRIFGPIAGAMLIFLWVLQQKPVKVVIPAIWYFVVALFTSYFTWPFIWEKTLARFFESLHIMVRFPWKNTLLFDGTYYSASSLRWFYLIKLIGIQLTIPALILLILGSILTLFYFLRWNRSRVINLLPVIWFYLALFVWVMLRPNTYDNFRQFLFITPPIFVFSALGFSFILNRIHHKYIGAIIGLVLILPGLFSNFYLHPYQYVYYNELVGGTSKIHNRYEADYWATSICEAARYLDPVIDDETSVFLITEVHGMLFQSCIQKTPRLVFQQDEDPANLPDYAVILSRWGAAEYLYPEMDILHSVSIGETPLVVIKKAP